MRFLGFISSRENQGTPPAALYEAMGGFIQEAFQAGVIQETGGLKPSSEATRFEIKNGELSVIDGPFAETREVIGGWVMYNVPSREVALDWSRRFMELHTRYWPGFECTSELREIEEMGEHVEVAQ